MEIKLIGNEDFMSLVELNSAMYSSIDSNITKFQAVNTLMALINTGKDFTAIGMYDEDVLVGFVTGMAYNETTFKFSGIYVVSKSLEYTKKLIDYSFDLIQKRGYKGWEVEATNANIASILEKYGATIKYTRYEKEFT